MIPPALIARASIPHDVGHDSSASPCQSNRPAALLPQTKSFSELLSRTRFSALSYRGRSFVPAGSGRRRTSVCALSVGVFPHTFESLALALEMNLHLPSIVTLSGHSVHVVHCASRRCLNTAEALDSIPSSCRLLFGPFIDETCSIFNQPGCRSPGLTSKHPMEPLGQ